MLSSLAQITGNGMVTNTNDLTTRNARNGHNDCQYSSLRHCMYVLHAIDAKTGLEASGHLACLYTDHVGK